MIMRKFEDVNKLDMPCFEKVILRVLEMMILESVSWKGGKTFIAVTRERSWDI